MDADRKERLYAASRLGRFISGGVLRKYGHESGQPVIIALESDPIDYILGRAEKYDPPVMVAIYHPGKDAFGFVTMEPAEPVQGERDIELPIDPAGHIGMLFECLVKSDTHSGLIEMKRWHPHPVIVSGSDQFEPVAG